HLFGSPPGPHRQTDDAKCYDNPRSSIHKSFWVAESRAMIDNRNRIVTGAAPGMTASDSFQSEPDSAPGAVFFHRLQKIFGTSGFKSAARARPGDCHQQRREH